MMIKYSEKDNTGLLLLNRPEKRNSLDPDLIKELKEKLNSIKEDDNVRSVIISGEGNSFCAGADLGYLKEINDFSSVMNEKDSESIAELFLSIYKFAKPVIAAVNGPAIAGGCGLATVCDFVIADNTNARFGYSEVKIGFLPAIVSIFLIKKIGEVKARQLLLSADIIDAKEAFRIGIADELSNNTVESAFHLASKLNKNSLYSIKETKDFTQKISNMNIQDAVDYCIRLNTISRSSEDFKSGINKFLSKL